MIFWNTASPSYTGLYQNLLLLLVFQLLTMAIESLVTYTWFALDDEMRKEGKDKLWKDALPPLILGNVITFFIGFAIWLMISLR